MANVTLNGEKWRVQKYDNSVFYLLLFSLTPDFLDRAKQEGKSLLVKEDIKIFLFADGIILTYKTPETPQVLSLSKNLQQSRRIETNNSKALTSPYTISQLSETGNDSISIAPNIVGIKTEMVKDLYHDN